MNFTPPPSSGTPREARPAAVGGASQLNPECITPRVTLHAGDCMSILPALADAIERGDHPGFDACITDPPYEIAMMGRNWDATGIAFDPNLWHLVLRCLKPGGHIAAFSLPKQTDQLGAAIRAAGASLGRNAEMRDRLLYAVSADSRWRAFMDTLSVAQLEAFLAAIEAMDGEEYAWVFGQGFPKSTNVAKAIDARLAHGSCRPEDIRRLSMAGDYTPSGRGRVNYDHGGGSAMNGAVGGWTATTDEAKEWTGWGTSLKPAFESIFLARKPLDGTVANTVLAHGTGAINIDACRIDGRERTSYGLATSTRSRGSVYGAPSSSADFDSTKGRYPANLIHDGSDAVLDAFAAFGRAGGGDRRGACDGRRGGGFADIGAAKGDNRPNSTVYADSGTAARFYYCAKAGSKDRWGTRHPTVKPLELMRHLVRMLVRPDGLVLDLFAGSGSTGIAAQMEGMNAVLIERDHQFAADIRERCRFYADIPATPAAPPRRPAAAAESVERPLPLFDN